MGGGRGGSEWVRKAEAAAKVSKLGREEGRGPSATAVQLGAAVAAAVASGTSTNATGLAAISLATRVASRYARAAAASAASDAAPGAAAAAAAISAWRWRTRMCCAALGGRQSGGVRAAGRGGPCEQAGSPALPKARWHLHQPARSVRALPAPAGPTPAQAGVVALAARQLSRREPRAASVLLGVQLDARPLVCLHTAQAHHLRGRAPSEGGLATCATRMLLPRPPLAPAPSRPARPDARPAPPRLPAPALHRHVRGPVVRRRLPPPLPQHGHDAQRAEAVGRQVEPRFAPHIALRLLLGREARLREGGGGAAHGERRRL
jgi:hypothetical protein